MRYTPCLILSLALMGSAYAQTAADPLQSAREALAARQPTKALAILQPLEAARAGEPAFDYLLGVARLDAGDAERAVFALERVLAIKPDHALARAEIGRAYLALGERDAGVKELQSVSKQGVPDEARKTIENYLSAFGAGPTRFSGYLEGTLGYDTNVNSAVSSDRLLIPLVGRELTLSTDARRHADPFYGVAGGLSFSHPLSQNWLLLGGAALNARYNHSYDRFDNRNLDGNLGLRYGAGAHAFTLGVQAQSFDVNEQRYRDATGLVGQWQYQIDPRTQITTFGQYVQLRYPSQGLRDADRSIAGLAFARVMEGKWSPTLFGSVYGGQERAEKSAGRQYGHTPWGFRIGGQLRPDATLTLFANASYEQRRHDARDSLFLVRREDKQTDLRFGLNYEPYRHWIITPQVSYTRNESNVSLNDYGRTVTSVTVRHDF